MATLGKQVGPAKGDVPSPPTSINEPFIEGGDSTEARVDLPHASDTIETDVEATPDMRPPPAMKRKHSEKVGGIGQHKKSRASFSLRALKQAMGLASGSSRPSSLLPRTTNPKVTQAVAAITNIFYIRLLHLHLLKRSLNLLPQHLPRPFLPLPHLILFLLLHLHCLVKG